MNTVTLPWGSEGIGLELPERWNLQGVFEPHALPGAPYPSLPG